MLVSWTGTLVDAVGVIIASILGGFIGKHMSDRYKNILLAMLGFIALSVGLESFCSYMPKSHYAVLFIHRNDCWYGFRYLVGFGW